MWVLLVILYSGYGSNLTTQEFADQAACSKALDFVQHDGPRSIRVYATCTPKATRANNP